MECPACSLAIPPEDYIILILNDGTEEKNVIALNYTFVNTNASLIKRNITAAWKKMKFTFKTKYQYVDVRSLKI